LHITNCSTFAATDAFIFNYDFMNKFQTFLPAVLMVLASGFCRAQSNLPPLDKSPMDMCYYPVDYPILKIQQKEDGPPLARVIYGRPQKNARSIFGDLVPYDMVWRVGANEATEIEFYRDVKIDGKKVPKGRYTLYAIPSPEKWIMVINKETDTWGAFGYDEKKDLIRVETKVIALPDPVEIFTICFVGTEKNKTSLMITWDNQQVQLPFSW
jgi:hypothetical protein